MITFLYEWWTLLATSTWLLKKHITVVFFPISLIHFALAKCFILLAYTFSCTSLNHTSPFIVWVKFLCLLSFLQENGSLCLFAARISESSKFMFSEVNYPLFSFSDQSVVLFSHFHLSSSLKNHNLGCDANKKWEFSHEFPHSF